MRGFRGAAGLHDRSGPVSVCSHDEWLAGSNITPMKGLPLISNGFPSWDMQVESSEMKR